MAEIAAERLEERIPLTPFEHSFVADDREHYPGVFFFRLTFDHALNYAKFTRALRSAMNRHPLLRCVLEGKATDATRNLRWKPSAALHMPFLDWQDDDSPFNYPGSRYGEIDLSREGGVRVFARQRQGKPVLTFQVHHACADGAGALQFIEDILVFYTNECAGANGKLTPRRLEAAKLAGRGMFHLSEADRARRRARDVLYTAKAFSFIPRAIACNPDESIDEDLLGNVYPASSVFEVPGPEFMGIRQTAKKMGGTLNDLLLRDLFLSVNAWNRANHPGRKSQAIRVGMPVNLRTAEDRLMPAANVVSMYFIDRAASSLDDPDALFRSIVRETQYVKMHNMGLAYIGICSLLGRCRGLLRRFLTMPVPECGSTVSLSNLGVVFSDSPLRHAEQKIDIGSVRLERIELLPPIRPHTNAAFGISTYAGRIVIALHYDARKLSQKDSDALVGSYVARIRETVRDVGAAQA